MAMASGNAKDKPELTLVPGRLTLADLRPLAAGPVTLSLDAGCREGIEASARLVAEIAAGDDDVYGINTGFGKLAGTRISQGQLSELQTNLVLSHCTGTGPLLGDDTVRLLMVLKINSLARGYSGVRPELIDALMALVNNGISPCIPSKGSVGASGDLAPLSHMAATLIGAGEARVAGRTVPAAEALAGAGLKALELGPKEGLALVNGVQVSTALALMGLFAAEDAFAAALAAGMLSTDAVKGSDEPFQGRYHELRGQAGQIDVAGVCRALIEGSEIRSSHVDCGAVQDPYSLRCQPQVMGACLDHMRFAAGVLEAEANAGSDNPLIFADTGEVVSGGNFHGQPVAMAADTLALAISEIGAISERRVALLVDSAMSGLPPFLVEGSGLHSGFMNAQVTSAALASENKSLAHPASVDSLPTSANQEDFVSMSTFAARRLGEMAENTATIVAIELLAAAQGVEFHAPLKTSPRLREVLGLVRAEVSRYDRDRLFAPDIEAARRLVTGGVFRRFAAGVLPSGPA